MGQSSNDVIPTAIHVSAADRSRTVSIPALEDCMARSTRRRRNSGTSSRSAGPICRMRRRSGWGRNSAATPAGSYAATAPRTGDRGVGGAGARRHGGRHRDEPARGFPGQSDAASRATNRDQLSRSEKPFRSAGRQGRRRRSERPAQDHRGQPVQNRQRHPLARQRPALRDRRDPVAGNPAGQLHHAGQGQPGHVRVADDGLRAGDRQRQLRHLGGREREFRVERDDAGDGAQSARDHSAAGPRVRVFSEKCVRGIQANEERCQELVELSWRW